MLIIRNLSTVKKTDKRVLTLGTFDGVHKAHQKIFKSVKDCSLKNDFTSMVVTFEPHPRTVVSKDFKVHLLSTLEEKVEIAEKSGIDELLVLDFTPEFAQQSYKEFIENILVNKVGFKHIIIGHDHKFGKDRFGNEEKLSELGEKFGFTVKVESEVLFNNEVISSTKIRNYLLQGNLSDAGKFLGRNYIFAGIVVKGERRGRILGFPTANIEVSYKNKLIPKIGVYAVKCTIENEIVLGVMNIGVRPTFGKHGDLVIEVHLFNFSSDIYGADIRVEFLKRLRDEKKFESKEELIYQIERDKKEAIQIIGNIIN
ncbi:MAG: bifunctional riboflavin kinase/FAD synthetase [Bacteroidota bacterium]